MKKILIVDDTPANLEAAKAYFSKNTDFEFAYAADRKSAEELLPGCDILITDREMPYQQGEKREDYKLEDKDDYENALKAHGYALLAEGAALEKPSLMVSSHQTLLFMKLDKLEFAKATVQLLKAHDPYSEESFRAAFKVNFQKDFVGEYPDIDKADPSTWELVFTKLSEEFNLNEKPNEIPGIKLQ